MHADYIQKCRYRKVGIMVRIVSLSFLTPRTCYAEANIVAEHIKCFTHLCDVYVCVCLRERERKERVREMVCIYYIYTIIYLALCSYIYTYIMHFARKHYISHYTVCSMCCLFINQLIATKIHQVIYP